jgi:aryl-alcohol dehydrogenase-like predicted oxidoreductase
VDYVNMGRSGLKVSRACLGTMNFGTGTGLAASDEAEAGKIIDAFLAAGHNFIDTANVYNGGESEQIVGRALRGRRDEVVLATKGFMPQGPGPNDRGLSRVHLTRALDASLRRLGTEYVDLYYCHQWDAATPIEETMATLDGFVQSGKVRYLGCSNFTAVQIVESLWAADRTSGTRFICLQPEYSLVNRSIEVETLPACERHGLGTAVYSPLAGGVLTGRYRPGTDPDPGSRMGKLLAMPHPMARQLASSMLTDRNMGIADAVGTIAAALGATPSAVALAWAAAQRGVTSVIIGPRSLDQLEQNLAGFELELPGSEIAHLTEIST